eukprot:TRINITY_DN5823_c0_g1_i1.p4 TRINITY_DN5823_c0_g1~~TRINITY_DN5823_c0_g1_i1.p4  ORF type:complete len:108 (+),score=16.85 TRINITY_DN5823_c0_g1_i1:47-370(+)
MYSVLAVYALDIERDYLGVCFVFFFSSRRRHTRCREVSWARRCVQETAIVSILSFQYGQASRLISIGQLHVLLHFHTRPINVVVSNEPLDGYYTMGYLILKLSLIHI